MMRGEDGGERERQPARDGGFVDRPGRARSGRHARGRGCGGSGSSGGGGGISGGGYSEDGCVVWW